MDQDAGFDAAVFGQLAQDLFERDYNAFLHFTAAALYFLAISLVIFFIFGLAYRHLTRHMPGAVPLRFRFGGRIR